MDFIRQYVENQVYGKLEKTEPVCDDDFNNIIGTEETPSNSTVDSASSSPSVQDPFAVFFIVLFVSIYVSFVFMMVKDLLADINHEEDDDELHDTPSQPAATENILHSDVFIPPAIASSNHSVNTQQNFDSILDDTDTPSLYPLLSNEDLGFLYNNSTFHTVEQKEKIARDAIDDVIFVENNVHEKPIINKIDSGPTSLPMDKEQTKRDNSSTKSLKIKIKRPVNTNRTIDSIHEDLQRRAKERGTHYSVEEIKKIREGAKKKYDKNLMRAKVKEMAKEF